MEVMIYVVFLTHQMIQDYCNVVFFYFSLRFPFWLLYFVIYMLADYLIYFYMFLYCCLLFLVGGGFSGDGTIIVRLLFTFLKII